MSRIVNRSVMYKIIELNALIRRFIDLSYKTFVFDDYLLLILLYLQEIMKQMVKFNHITISY